MVWDCTSLSKLLAATVSRKDKTCHKISFQTLSISETLSLDVVAINSCMCDTVSSRDCTSTQMRFTYIARVKVVMEVLTGQLGVFRRYEKITAAANPVC